MKCFFIEIYFNVSIEKKYKKKIFFVPKPYKDWLWRYGPSAPSTGGLTGVHIGKLTKYGLRVRARKSNQSIVIDMTQGRSTREPLFLIVVVVLDKIPINKII